MVSTPTHLRSYGVGHGSPYWNRSYRGVLSFPHVLLGSSVVLVSGVLGIGDIGGV